ncbi:deoxyhypusine hydroxylase [Irineochytrium annulatum]|nr:deoxyhypusine hydroxylase [Irineochytrium annulatum]
MTAGDDHAALEAILLNKLPKPTPLCSRFRALFALKSLRDDRAVDIIGKGFTDPSALLKHELAYVLGQMKNPHAIPILNTILSNTDEEPMVRHEAAEALGAIGDESSLDILESFMSRSEEVQVVRETCELAIANIKYEKAKTAVDQQDQSPYSSVDPAPALPTYKRVSSAELGTVMMNPKLPLFERYRAMFSLRNQGTTEAVLTLAKGFDDESALFRHEIAYVFGQMQHPASVPALTQVLSDVNEMGMVRHEAAEALGSIATEECVPILRAFVNDDDSVIAQSCMVALDIYDNETSDQVETVDKFIAGAI